MYIIGMVLEDYKGSYILMNGCKYFILNGKFFVYVYVKRMYKLCIIFVLFIIFKK